MEMKPVTFETLGGGQLGELFAYELARVLEDIDNPNTPTGAVRSITLEVVIKPMEDRGAAQVAIRSRSKLAGVKPAGAIIHLGRKGGKLAAYATDPKQMELPMDKPTLVGGEEKSSVVS